MKTNETNHHAIRAALQVADHMPAMKARKEPVIAAVLGFAFGGIGLGLYFQSWLDFFVPTGVWIIIGILGVPTGEMLVILAPVFCAFYGYRRATASNAKLAGATIEAEIVADVSSVPRPRSSRPYKAITDGARASTSETSQPKRRTGGKTRLKRLDKLRTDGLLTEEEYNAKRQEILADM